MYSVYSILYIVYCIVFSRGRQPMARVPNVALIKKVMALFKSKGAEKKVTKNLGRLAKKYELMALGKRRSLIFPFFGPPTTKGWRPLVYSIQYTLFSIHV